MAWEWKGFAGLLFVGIVVIAIGIGCKAFADSAIIGIQNRLTQSDVSQAERWNLQGSLDWWKSMRIAFFAPMLDMTNLIGIVFVLLSAVYAMISLFHGSGISGKIQPVEDPLEREYSKSSTPRILRKTGFPIAAGILTVIASSVIALVAVATLISAIQLLSYRQNMTDVGGFLAVSLLNFLAFAFGLTAGIFTLKRRQFVFSILGISLLLPAGFITILGYGLTGSAWTQGLLFGLPVVVLAILSIVFDSISKNEFALHFKQSMRHNVWNVRDGATTYLKLKV